MREYSFLWRSIGIVVLSIIIIKFTPDAFIFFNPFLMFFTYEIFTSKMNSTFLIKSIFIGFLSDSFSYYPLGITALGYLIAGYLLVKSAHYLNLKKEFDRLILVFVILVFEFGVERLILNFFEYKGFWLGVIPEVFKFLLSFILGFLLFIFFRKNEHREIFE